ncbi:MAG TPA: hypothetical protein VGL77_10935, partial [Armatimonadota bacterium]
MSDPTSLRNADPLQQMKAAAVNHRELFCVSALAAGGEIRVADGVTWTYRGRNGAAMIAFPELRPENAGTQLDEIVEYYLRHPSPKLAGCWSLDPPEPYDLGVRLLARGFQPGWRPCWMSLDLTQIASDLTRPSELTVSADSQTDLRGFKNLPYTDPDESTSLEMTQQYSDRVRRFVARLDGKV